MTTGAAFARGQSKQDYSTPREFLDAVKKRWSFDEFDVDLAAVAENSVASRWFGPPVDMGFKVEGRIALNALLKPWNWSGQNAWLNPPFDTIRPWAKKCREWSKRNHPSLFNFNHLLNQPVGQRLFFLVSASVGSEWWAEFVDKHAAVKFLRPRLSFDGKNSYPKDCALVLYGETPGYECWRWK